jgi:AcrR family transcriptional regulator
MVPATRRPRSPSPSPRPYHLGRRQAGVDRTRARILKAARALLMAPGASAFSLDAVARRARVTRATVYQRFGSRTKLLEALFDDMARQGGMWDLAEAFRQPDPDEALARFVATFGRFWTVHRPVVQRLFALSVLDPALERALRARNEWRRQGLRQIVRRRHNPSTKDAIDVLFALTSFHFFDSLAGPDRAPSAVVPDVVRLTRQVLGLARRQV